MDKVFRSKEDWNTHPTTGEYYQLNSQSALTWPQAEASCKQQGASLLSINDFHQQAFVTASTDELWIGLNDRKTEGQFDWIDHSTVSFTSWEFGKPAVSTDIKDCVLIRGENGNWADRVCEEKHGSICMKMSASIPSGNKVERDNGCKRLFLQESSDMKTWYEARDYCMHDRGCKWELDHYRLQSELKQHLHEVYSTKKVTCGSLEAERSLHTTWLCKENTHFALL
ncbi:Macrophage mannose receptor 1 [Dissostichus eleginoides]|uniref:Macrophage mannose receptor 1 n=1 Tax=Dissostichus eleginoides TaxID=100907 RepID=A0AAD9B9A7_DISEL|nr:Macrophage mannose receptor 1 [Dissostichus eleginoides]